MGSPDLPASERPRELLLFRHGIAAERADTRVDPGAGADAGADAQRALTAEGRSRTRAVAAQLMRLGLGAERLVSSPLVRARQTGEIAVAAGLAPRLELDGALAPGGDPLPLVWESSCSRLVLVGHEPDLGLLACRLLGAPARPDSRRQPLHCPNSRRARWPSTARRAAIPG